jgi:multidrug efflux pump subunit AcrA (membrane-fusion protein)
MTLDDHSRADLLSHHDVLIQRARALADSLRRELTFTDGRAELCDVQGRLTEIGMIIAANEKKAAQIRSEAG